MTDQTGAPKPELSEALKTELQPLLDQGQTIAAVRLCRERLDCDLVQAKALVDGLNPKAEGAIDEPPLGIMSPLGIFVLILILSGYLYIR